MAKPRNYTHSIRPKNKTPNDVAKKHYAKFYSGPSPRNLVTGFIINAHSYKSTKTVTEHPSRDMQYRTGKTIVKL